MSDNQLEKNRRLLEVRRALGMTQAEMATLLGMDRGHLSSIENMKGGRNVRPDASYILAAEKKVNPKWFETGEGSMFLKEKPAYSVDSVRFMRVSPSEERGMVEDPMAEYIIKKELELEKKLSEAKDYQNQILEEISQLKDKIIQLISKSEK